MALRGTKALQVWCQQVTEGYPNVKVDNMTKSWKDGLAFCAIIHHFRPELIDFTSLSKKNIRENNTLAFEVAERELGIPALLDPEDMVTMSSPDKLSILTYLSQYYSAFKDKKPGKDNGVSDKGREFRKRSLKKSKDKENTAAESGPLPAKISMKSDKCEICTRRVYLVERQVVDGRLFHRNCFRCTKCKSTLRPDSYKLTKDPRKFECMCHSDGPDIWNLRMNVTSRAGARLAGKDGENSIWQSRGTKPGVIHEHPEKPPERLPPKQSTPIKAATPAEPAAMGNSPHKPGKPADKPPPPPTMPMHPHLLKNAARARFNAQGDVSPAGSPQLQRQQQNGGSLGSLAMETELTKSQDSLDRNRADSPAKPVPMPRPSVKPEQPQKLQSSEEPSSKTPAEASSKADAAVKENKKDITFSSTEDEDTNCFSDVRSIQEGDSLGFESSDLENVRLSCHHGLTDNSPVETDEDTTSPEEPSTVKAAAAPKDEIKDSKEVGEEKLETEKVDDKSPAPSVEEVKEGEECLNIVNEALSNDQEKGDLEIGTTDAADKSIEEGSSGDSAFLDTKAELSDSGQPETTKTEKPQQTEKETESESTGKEQIVEEKSSDSPEKSSEIDIGDIDKGKDEANETKSSGVNGDYDDSMNPFGSEEDEEEDQGGYDASLNPFGDDDDDQEADEGHESHASDGSVNPFTGSPIEETPLSLRLKNENRPASFSHSKRPERPPPPILSSGSYSVKTRSQILDELKRDRETLKKKAAGLPADGSPGGITAPPRSRKSRRAPPPPTDGPKKSAEGEKGGTPTPAPRVGVPTANGAGHGKKLEPIPSPRLKKAQKPERPKIGPPSVPPVPHSRTHSSSKRRAPAPPAVKRDVGKDHMDTNLIQLELTEIESRQRELESTGVELEKKLRQDNDDNGHHDDDLLTEWFDVVNKKNRLVRREGELIAQAQQQELELQHAEIEFELRVILQKQEHERIDADATREEQLLELLVEVVTKRNQVVERLEEDRLREEAEDRDIEALIFANHGDKKKEKEKEKKHKKKHHLKLGHIK